MTTIESERDDPNEDDPNEEARLLLLQRAFGGELTPAQERELAAFERSADGRRFAAQAARLRARLALVTSVPVEPPRGAELRARFEERMRAEARRVRARFAPFCLGVLGVFALAGLAATLALRDDPRAARLPDLWILLAAGAAVVCVAVWQRASSTLRTPDLTRFLLAARERVRRGPRLSPRTLFVLLLCAALLAPRWGWPWAGGLALASLVVLRAAAVGVDALERRRRLRQDAELWAWWQRERG